MLSRDHNILWLPESNGYPTRQITDPSRDQFMPVTMKDIAGDLGVSIVTVSKVLRNHGDIGEATRKRVLKRVKELNYQPNWVARSLVTRRTHMVGLVVPDLGSQFFAEIAMGLGRKIQAKGFHLVTSSSEEDPRREEQEIDWLVSRRVDALAICSVQADGAAEVFQRVEEHKVPYLLIDRPFAHLKVGYVGADDEAIGRTAAEHLIDIGCSRIAHIRGPQQLASATAREHGWLKAVTRRRFALPDDYVLTAGETSETVARGGYLAAQQLLAAKPRPDGIFCFNDSVAIGAMKAIQEAGLSIPGDVALVGSGNLRHSDFLTVPLSTIDQHSVEIGDRAGDLVLRMIRAKRTPPARTILVKPDLIARASTRPDS